MPLRRPSAHMPKCGVKLLAERYMDLSIATSKKQAFAFPFHSAGFLFRAVPRMSRAIRLYAFFFKNGGYHEHPNKPNCYCCQGYFSPLCHRISIFQLTIHPPLPVCRITCITTVIRPAWRQDVLRIVLFFSTAVRLIKGSMAPDPRRLVPPCPHLVCQLS